MYKIKNMFRKVIFFFRRILIEKHFFENTFLESRYEKSILKKSILDWALHLKAYHKVTVDSFAYLFSKYEGISFPITFNGFTTSQSGYLNITDNLGEQFYMNYYPNSYNDMQLYEIGKRDKSLDVTFEYKLSKTDSILLNKIYIMPLNADGTNSKRSVIIDYSLEKYTRISFENKIYKLQISYSSQNSDFDDEIVEYLLSLISNEEHFYNIFVVANHIITNLKMSRPFQITSSKDNSVLSEFRSYEDVLYSKVRVIHYSFTEWQNNSNIKLLHQISLDKGFNEFISEYK